MSKNTKGIVLFLLIAFGIAWLNLLAVWLLGMGSAQDAEAAQPNPLLYVITAPLALAPAIAAIVVRKWVTREGFGDAGLRLHLRTGWPYYLYAFLFPLIVVPIAVAAWVLLRSGQPDWSALSLETLLPLPIMALAMTLLYFGEEFGWRGYLQLRLAPGRPLLAAIGTGLIWSAWHYPMLLLGSVGVETGLALLLHLTFSVLLSIFLGWLQVRSESVWPACLAHAVNNSILIGALTALMADLPAIIAWGAYGAAGTAILAVLVIAVGRFDARAPQQPEGVS
jgi:membrane protease YdiL (CAAX protease family)